MLAGITGSRAAAALVVLGPISQAGDWFPGLSDWLFSRFDPEAVTPTTPAAFAAVAALGAVVWLGLAAASSVVTDYGFAAFTTGDIPAGSVINSVTIEAQYKSDVTNSVGATFGPQPHAINTAIRTWAPRAVISRPRRRR